MINFRFNFILHYPGFYKPEQLPESVVRYIHGLLHNLHFQRRFYCPQAFQNFSAAFIIVQRVALLHHLRIAVIPYGHQVCLAVVFVAI